MARGGRFTISIDDTKFLQSLEVAASRVERGTKKATRAALEWIAAESLRQVPRDTETLANSLHYEVIGSYKNFTGVINYGMHKNEYNPKTGQYASEYMVTVHEDLTAHHPKGKAKFLEDPLLEFYRQFGGYITKEIRREL